MSSLMLLDEHPIIVNPTLACILGLEAAVFLQQIHYWTEQKRRAPQKYERSFKEGHAWVYKTHAEWLEEMPFLGSRSKLQRMIKMLKTKGILVVDNHNQWAHDNTPWYRIDYQMLNKLTEEPTPQVRPQVRPQVKMTRGSVKMTTPPGQNDTAPQVKMTTPPGQNDPSITRDYTETTKPETTHIPPVVPQKGDGVHVDQKFIEWWASYPKKVGKSAALKAWRRLSPEQKAKTIADTASRPQKDPQWLKNNGEFIPNPATYLNQGRYDDEWQPASPLFGQNTFGTTINVAAEPVETGQTGAAISLFTPPQDRPKRSMRDIFGDLPGMNYDAFEEARNEHTHRSSGC